MTSKVEKGKKKTNKQKQKHLCKTNGFQLAERVYSHNVRRASVRCNNSNQATCLLLEANFIVLTSF